MIHFIHNSTAIPKSLLPWRDSNQGLLVPEVDAMSTAPRRQGFGVHFNSWFEILTQLER
jgi:hypothetical protein